MLNLSLGIFLSFSLSLCVPLLTEQVPALGKRSTVPIRSSPGKQLSLLKRRVISLDQISNSGFPTGETGFNEILTFYKGVYSLPMKYRLSFSSCYIVRVTRRWESKVAQCIQNVAQQSPRGNFICKNQSLLAAFQKLTNKLGQLGPKIVTGFENLPKRP